MQNVRSIVWTVCATLAMTMSAGVARASTQVVLKSHRISFTYRSESTVYTCAALEDKIARVLQSLGAVGEIAFAHHDCSMWGAARLHVSFRAPIEATAQNIESLTTFRTTEVISARLRGLKLPSAPDLPRFSATWREVAVYPNRSLRMTGADCQLAEQVRHQLLPHLAIREQPQRLICMPGHINPSSRRLAISALVIDHREPSIRNTGTARVASGRGANGVQGIASEAISASRQH